MLFQHFLYEEAEGKKLSLKMNTMIQIKWALRVKNFLKTKRCTRYRDDEKNKKYKNMVNKDCINSIMEHHYLWNLHSTLSQSVSESVLKSA